MRRRGSLKGPVGSHERPASPLLFRLVLAVFGLVVLVGGAVLAAVLGSAPLTVVLSAGAAAAALNVYRVVVRRRHERR